MKKKEKSLPIWHKSPGAWNAYDRGLRVPPPPGWAGHQIGFIKMVLGLDYHGKKWIGLHDGKRTELSELDELAPKITADHTSNLLFLCAGLLAIKYFPRRDGEDESYILDSYCQKEDLSYIRGHIDGLHFWLFGRCSAVPELGNLGAWASLEGLKIPGSRAKFITGEIGSGLLPFWPRYVPFHHTHYIAKREAQGALSFDCPAMLSSLATAAFKRTDKL